MLKLFDIFSQRLRRIFGEREIQAMVVLSLTFQTILIVMGYRRKVSTSNNLILLLWSSYLLASWFATVSLSIISSNLGNAENKPIDTKLVITSFWAPFFLLHLAGPDTITAYSLEDNALWRRHALTLASQVGVTVFVIIRAWENTVLNILTVTMMIPGIIKIGERIWVLRSASSENFKATTLRSPDPGPNYARYMEEYRSKKEEGFDVTPGTFVEAPIVSDISIPKPANAKIADAFSLHCAYELFKTFKQLFSDLILSIQDIKNSQSFFQEVQFEEAFKVIEVELGFMYDVFYTKAYKVYSLMGGILRLISFSSTVIVLLVFAIVVDDKSVYSREERMVTYVLLGGAIFLEIYSVLILITSDWSMLWLSKRKTAMVDLWYNSISSVPLLVPKKRWSNTMGQYNLITYCLHRKKPTCRAIQRFLFHYELLEKQRYEKSMVVSVDLKKLIFEHLLEKSNIASELKVCKELCACRGERVLKNAKCLDCINKEKNKKQNEDVEVESEEVPKDAKCFYELSKENRKTLQDSVEAEFDQSILLWHIATTLCYYFDRNTNSNNSVYCPNYEASKSLSDYMLYLQVMRPILLPNGIEQIRFQDTCAEAKEFFDQRKSIFDETQACIKLLEVNTEIPPSIVKGDRSKSVLFDGCRLAKSLQCIEYQKKWELVSHVWVEMLCYAATKCRWNHHAQQLIRGGELFTHFWLLMSHLGITEQFQISKGHARAMLVVH